MVVIIKKSRGMKKKLITFLAFTLFAISGHSQSRYCILDSLPIERVLVYFDKEIDNESFISCGGGDYMVPVPYKDNMMIRLTEDRTKAIVVYNSYSFGRRLEFEVEDNERRLVLWYKDKNIYCGYIYDKLYKICKYFESKKEFRRFFKHPHFRGIHDKY